MLTDSNRPQVATGKRIPELDGVRGLAIALVLIYHYADVPDTAVVRELHTLYGSKALFVAFVPTRLMWSGVDLFFVLSGFLIGGILLDYRESRHYFSAFYARRIHRIFPIYYLLIALVALGTQLWPLSPLFRGEMSLWAFPLYAQNLLGDYTKAPDSLEVTWSLAVEEQFYLLFPFIVRFCSRSTLKWLLGACIIGAPLVRGVLILHGWGFESVYPLLPARADTLALGVVAAMIVRSEKATRWVTNRAKSLYVCLVGLFAMLPLMLKWTAYRYVGTLGYSLLGVTYFLMILLLLVAPFPFMRAAFSVRWLRWLGMVSYCVYLIHQPMRIGLFLLFLPGSDPVITGPRALVVTLATLVATLVVAQLSWIVIEKRLIRRAHVRYHY